MEARMPLSLTLFSFGGRADRVTFLGLYILAMLLGGGLILTGIC